MTPNLTNWKEALHDLLATSGGTPTERALQDLIAALLRQALEGKSTKATWYRLTPAHVRALVKFHQAILYYGRNRIHIRKEMADTTAPFALTKDQWTNFSFLRTFGLVAHYDPENPRGGEWKMTELGAKFLKGKSVVHTRKLILNGRIIERDEKSLKHVNEFRGKVPEYPKNFQHVLVATATPSHQQAFLPVKVGQIHQAPQR